MRKVAIIAAGPTWLEVPFEDPTFEFWGINAAHRMYAAHTSSRWFQIHLPGSAEGHIDDPDHIAWLKESHNFPIYMTKSYPEYPSSVAYPFDKVVKSCCPDSGPYFTNTVDYMVTLAILEEVEEIHMFGTDFISDEDNDYYKRRQSLEHYCGLAKGRNIKVVIPDDCALLKAEYIYGFNKKPRDNADTIKRLQGLRTKIGAGRNNAQENYLSEKAKMDRAEGALGMLDQITHELSMRKRGVLPY